MKQNYLASILMVATLLLFLPTVNAQNSRTLKPTKVVEMKFVDVSEPMREVQTFNKKRSMVESKVINNKIDFREDPNMDRKWAGTDPVIQDHINALRTGAPNTVEQVLTGVSNDDNLTINGFRVAPPDTQGDVGLNHYVQMTNLLTIIYNKDGSVALGPFPNSNFWTGAVIDGIDFSNENSGDPIVLYDEYEDRWIVSHFSTTYDYVLFAISQTSDPTGAYYRYGMAFPNFPDYPKFGIWDDGIYFTVNEFSGNTFAGSSLVGIEKAGLYAGTGSSGFYLFLDFPTYPDYGSWLPADADGPTPPPNSTHYTMSRSYGPANTMHLITTEPDWVNPANTVITISDFTVDPYFTSGTIFNAQPNGQNLASLGDRLMYRLQYRNFGTHQAMVVNHSVQNSAGGPFGVRWYELRAASGDDTWSTHQTGTFLPSDGENRWMGSIAMNGAGEIALGYSVSSSTTHPSIRFTGQSAGASGTGVFDLPETSIFTGTASQFNTSRWGDYSMMSVDPSDDETFWYTQENGTGVRFGWATQIAEITLGAPDDPAMIAVTPASLAFTVDIDGTDSDLLNIANTGIDGAADLTWSLSLAKPIPPASYSNSNGTRAGQPSINAKNNAESINNDRMTGKNFIENEGFAYDAIDFSQVSGQVALSLDPNYIGQSTNRSMDVLFDNGPLVNSPGTGFGGADESVVQNISLGMTVLGFGHQYQGNNSVAEDFIVSDPDGWQVDEFVFYAYQSFAGNTSTITGIYYEIWDGDPSNPSSNIIYGDFSVNKLVSSSWTNIYRVGETSSGNADRAIMESTAIADVILAQGTYWIVWQCEGSAVSGPWAPPITINGQISTGNGQQSINGGAFSDLIDAGNTQGLPFLVKGSIAIPPCPWLTLSPQSGTIAAGTSQDVVVNIDASGLAEGTYECELNISSNAANDPLVTIPVTLIVAVCEAPTLTTKDITVELDSDGNASIVALDILEPTSFSNLTSTANWLGFVGFTEDDVFYGDITAIGDVKSTIDAGADEITLQPNFNPYYPDNFDNPVLQGSTYIEEFGTLAGGASFSFTGNTTSNTLDPRYDAYAFIRIFNAAFEYLGEIRDPLIAGDDFSVQYNNTESDAYIFQYGFTVEGTSGAYEDEASLGNAVVQGMTLNIAPYSSCGLESVVISQTDFDCSDIGSNEVTVTATDINGEVSTGTAEVTVEDNELPVLTAISSPITLWPPNHKYETIDMSQLVVSVDDNCGDLLIEDVFITSVTSDEEEDANGNGDGKTKNDIVIANDCQSVDLRKERNGNGNGRVYTIFLEVVDASGNSGTAKCEVHVPHNNGETAIDDGMEYEVLSSCSNDKSTFATISNGGDIQLMNYPNPFNGSTTISFTLSETDNTILKVYDTFGKEVATLFDGMAESGKQYLLEFKGENLSKGIYVYHLQSGNNVSMVKKMILMK